MGVIIWYTYVHSISRISLLRLIYVKAVPNVIGLDGRPMPRKAIKTKKESDDKFWDFARQFFFGLWGFRQRPYPPGRPIDAAQAIGYKRLEKRYHDCKFAYIHSTLNTVKIMLFFQLLAKYCAHLSCTPWTAEDSGSLNYE